MTPEEIKFIWVWPDVSYTFDYDRENYIVFVGKYGEEVVMNQSHRNCVEGVNNFDEMEYMKAAELLALGVIMPENLFKEFDSNLQSAEKRGEEKAIAEIIGNSELIVNNDNIIGFLKNIFELRIFITERMLKALGYDINLETKKVYKIQPEEQKP